MASRVRRGGSRDDDEQQPSTSRAADQPSTSRAAAEEEEDTNDEEEGEVNKDGEFEVDSLVRNRLTKLYFDIYNAKYSLTSNAKKFFLDSRKIYPEITIEKVRKMMNPIVQYQIHKSRKSGKTNPIKAQAPMALIGFDIMFLTKFIDEGNIRNNSGMVALWKDAFTRKLFGWPISDKSGETITQAFRDFLAIVKDDLSPGCVLYSDDEPGMRVPQLKALLNEYHIVRQLATKTIHASVIESEHRWLRVEYIRYVHFHQEGDFNVIIPELIEHRNNQKRRALLNYSANQMYARPELQVLLFAHINPEQSRGEAPPSAQHDKGPKFKVGDIVRVQLKKRRFQKDSEIQGAQWSRQLYMVAKISYMHSIPVYRVRDLYTKEYQKRGYYNYEMQKTDDTGLYEIDKVIKRRRHEGKNQIYATLRGFGKKAYWLDADTAIDTKGRTDYN